MKTKVNRRKVIKQIKDQAEKEKRGKVTLYLNSYLYESFQAACDKENLAASTVVEKLMEEFLK